VSIVSELFVLSVNVLNYDADAEEGLPGYKPCQLIIDYRRFGGTAGGDRKFLRNSVINCQSTGFHIPKHLNLSVERCVYMPGFGNLFTCPSLEIVYLPISQLIDELLHCPYMFRHYCVTLSDCIDLRM
jgi:hypothetical protein